MKCDIIGPYKKEGNPTFCAIILMEDVKISEIGQAQNTAWPHFYVEFEKVELTQAERTTVVATD